MSEHALQVAVAHMLQLVLDPERTWWSAIDAGAGKLSKRAAGMMKARGVKRGMPDIVVMWWHNVVGKMIGIELKVEKGRLSPDQRLVEREWNKMGFAIYTARSLEEVQQVLDVVDIPLRHRMTVFPRLEVRHVRPQRSAPARHQRPRRRRKSTHHLPLVLADPAQKE